MCHLVARLVFWVTLLALPSALGAVTATRSIVDLQPWKQTTSLPLNGQVATLINLNPRINVWFVLTLESERETTSYHLENPAPQHQTLSLATGGLSIVSGGTEPAACELWPAGAGPVLEQARRSRRSFASICDGRLILRNPAAGYRTRRELMTEVLRDHVWGGERIIALVRDRLLRDSHLEKATALSTDAPDSGLDATAPLPALLNPVGDGLRAVPQGLGIDLVTPNPGQVAFGSWHPARLVPEAYVSLITAGQVEPGLLSSNLARVKPLDPVEASALVYLIAFDVKRLELGYELGTDHPRVGWSNRSLPHVREPGSPGPDGIDAIAPLVATGIVNPLELSRTVATFTGGFKRAHGAFRYGELAHRNSGSHYGWMQHGVVFSSLQPGLATLMVLEDGAIDLRTWGTADHELLAKVRHARQNGVPIIETDPDSGEPVPGALVSYWREGNWSGSAGGSLRTVRAGACLQRDGDREFLIYAYFSSVTPSAMARVFQAYRCRYAMLLDMNALEHTYLAIYGVGEGGVIVQHLVRGMEEVDRPAGGERVPRFIGYPDNRDFFTVMRRREVEP